MANTPRLPGGHLIRAILRGNRITSSPKISLRTLTDNDWRLWRELRLQALEEAPYAFSSRLADWQGVGDSEMRWRSRLLAVPLNIVAELNGNPAGMVSGTAPSPDGTVELISMWVAPFARGRGVGDCLVTAIVNWAEQQHALRVSLAVFEGNQSALRLYRRHQFTDRGTASQDGSASACERQLVRDIRPAI